MPWPNSNEQPAGPTAASVLPAGPGCSATRPRMLQPSTVATGPAGAPSIDSTQAPR